MVAKIMLTWMLIVVSMDAAYGVSFVGSDLMGVSLVNPTTLQFGPDDRLYVSQQDGLIFAFEVRQLTSGLYEVVGTETIDLIQRIPNHDDDGALNLAVTTRQVTGMIVVGTRNMPVLYVTSSDPRIGGGETVGDIKLDTNSGVLSRLSWTPRGWDKVDLVRGLPRSEENHASNGLQLDEVTDTLYLANGGVTNAGAPSKKFAFLTEYALSGAILQIDLKALEVMPIQGMGLGQFVYDLPTLDDPTRANVGGILDLANPAYTGDIGDPFGGNDGLNQARLVEGSPIQIYASGLRNAYDVALMSDGRLYTWDNGANQTWGGHPDQEGTFIDRDAGGALATQVTNHWGAGEPGSVDPGPNDDAVNNLDGLHLVGNINTDPPGSYYGGHPNPVRANPSGAGLFTHEDGAGSEGTFRTQVTRDATTSLPIDWPPVPVHLANPIEADFQNAGVDDLSLVTIRSSVNGLTTYTASTCGGALQGDLLAAAFDGSVYRVHLNRSGGLDTPDDVTVFASGFGALPLDVTAQGDRDLFPGSVWVASYGSGQVTIFEPRADSWRELTGSTDDLQSRHEADYVRVGEAFYLLGGREALGLNRFDPISNTWTAGALPPVPFHHVQAVAFEDELWVMGAMIGEFPDEKPIETAYIYNPARDEWREGPGIERPRGGAGLVVHDGQFYLVSGIVNGHLDGHVPWLDRYDPTTKSWTQLPDAPRARDHFQAQVIEGKLWLAGGRRTAANSPEGVWGNEVAAVDVYTISTGEWSTLGADQSLPTPRAGTASAVLNGKLIISGGESTIQEEAHNEVDLLDPATGQWSRLSPLLTGRHGTGLIAYRGQLYTVSGSGRRGGGPNLMEQEVWQPCPPGDQTEGRPLVKVIN